MKYRKLRIAWSVGCGVVAVLLCVLWVRSYLREDVFTAALSSQLGGNVRSSKGGLEFGVFVTSDIQWGHYSLPSDLRRVLRGVMFDTLGFSARHVPNQSWAIKVPDWFVIGLLALSAVIPWRISRFSLRTLLIAITLVAVLLGLVVWATR